MKIGRLEIKLRPKPKKNTIMQEFIDLNFRVIEQENSIMKLSDAFTQMNGEALRMAKVQDSQGLAIEKLTEVINRMTQ